MNRVRILLVLPCLSISAAALAQAAPAAQPVPAVQPMPAQPVQSAPVQTAPAQPAPATAPTPADTAAAAPVEVAPRTADELQIEGLEVQPGGLTADETARRALAASTDVAQKRAEIAAADERIRQTTIQFFPQLTLRAGYTRTSPVNILFGAGGASLGGQLSGVLHPGPCPNDGTMTCILDKAGNVAQVAPPTAQVFSFPVNNFLLTAGLTVPLSDYVLRLAHASDAAKADQKAARLAEGAEALRVQTDARVLYFNWVRANGQVFIARKALERNNARLEDAKVGFQVGTLTKADLLRLEALVANSQQAVVQADSFTRLAGAQLAIIMHDEKSDQYHIGESAHPTATVTELDAMGMRKLVYDAWQRRLELRALENTQKSVELGEKAVRAGSWPRLDGTADATYANPNPRYFPPANVWNGSWSAGVVASWNITDAFLTDARGDELAAQGQKLRAQYVGLQAAIANEVISAQLDAGTATTGLATSEVALRAAEEAYRVTTDLFRVGRATTTDLIDAETELLSAKLANTNARIDLTIAGLRLTHASGQDAPPR
jgi:outer membrane protein TolC